MSDQGPATESTHAIAREVPRASPYAHRNMFGLSTIVNRRRVFFHTNWYMALLNIIGTRTTSERSVNIIRC